MLYLILFVVYLIIAFVNFSFEDTIHIIYGVIWVAGAIINLIAGCINIRTNIENKEAREKWQEQGK